MSDDILTRIDEAMAANERRFDLAAGGEVELALFGSQSSAMRWRPLGSPSSTEEEAPERAEAAPPVSGVSEGASPWVSFTDVAAGPSAGTEAAVDVRRRVQDGTAPAPDPVEALRSTTAEATHCPRGCGYWTHIGGLMRLHEVACAAAHRPGGTFMTEEQFDRYLETGAEDGPASSPAGASPQGAVASHLRPAGLKPEIGSRLADEAQRPEREYRAAPRLPWWNWKRWTR